MDLTQKALSLSTACFLLLFYQTAALSAARDRWETRQNALVCPSYFVMQDAEVAAARGDTKWLNETNCSIIAEPVELSILQPLPLGGPSEIWRVRLHPVGSDGTTAYLRANNVMGWTEKGMGPVAYHEVFRLNAAARQTVTRPTTATDSGAIRAHIAKCWNPPAGARDARDLIVVIRVTVNPDGTVRQAMIEDQSRMSDPLFRAAAESARRAFFNPHCTPLPANAGLSQDILVEFR